MVTVLKVVMALKWIVSCPSCAGPAVLPPPLPLPTLPITTTSRTATTNQTHLLPMTAPGEISRLAARGAAHQPEPQARSPGGGARHRQQGKQEQPATGPASPAGNEPEQPGGTGGHPELQLGRGGGAEIGRPRPDQGRAIDDKLGEVDTRLRAAGHGQAERDARLGVRGNPHALAIDVDPGGRDRAARAGQDSLNPDRD